MTLTLPQVPDWTLSPRWRLRPSQAAAMPLTGPATRMLRCIRFRLGNERVALALDEVERILPRLGRVSPFAGGPHIDGVALERGLPLLVVDLEATVARDRSTQARLEERPALVLPYGSGRVALSICGPADLLEAHPRACPLEGHGGLTLEGFVDDDVPLLSMASVRAWLDARLGEGA